MRGAAVSAAAAAAGRRRENLVLAALTSATLAFALLHSMVVTALPAFQRELETTTAWVTWLLTVYLLSASVATPLLGRLGDQYGKKRVLLAALGTFLVGSLGAIAAWDIWSLIVFRALQGAGFAVFALGFAIVREELPRERIGFGLGLVSSAFGAGGGLGYVLSGVIIDHVSWRWIFVIGSAGIALAFALVARFVPESRLRVRARPDVAGAAVLSAGMFCLLLALTEGRAWGWGSSPIVSLFAAAAVLLAVWPLVELRVLEPMVDVRMLARRPVLLTNAATLATGVSLFAVLATVPAFIQAGRGGTHVGYGFAASVTMTGIYLIPHSFALLAVGPPAGAYAQRHSPRWTLSVGTALAAASLAALALWNDQPWQLIVAMTAYGVGMAINLAATPLLIAGNVAAAEMGVAQGINTIMRTLGGVVGGQAAAAIVGAHVIGATGALAERGFVIAFWASAAAGIAAAGLAALVTPLSSRNRRARR